MTFVTVQAHRFKTVLAFVHKVSTQEITVGGMPYMLPPNTSVVVRFARHDINVDGAEPHPNEEVFAHCEVVKTTRNTPLFTDIKSRLRVTRWS